MQDQARGGNMLGRHRTRSVQLRDTSGVPAVTPGEIIDARRLQEVLDERYLPPRYRVDEPLGAGASSRVFKVFDQELGRSCAVKIFLVPVTANDEYHRRFQHEIQVTAGFQHPNLLPIYDTGISESGLAWLSMALMGGRSLHDLLDDWAQEGQPPATIATLPSRVQIFVEVCRALAHAHEHGVVHHDVKPGNILIGARGEVMLADWGAASTAAMRAAGHTPRVGTPAYMAPEQARGEACDERADIASLGASVFHVLYGRPPLTEPDPTLFRAYKEVGAYAPPTARERRGVPRTLQAVVERCLQAKAADRYPSVLALLDDLQAWLADEPVSVLREHLPQRLLRSYRRQPRSWWLALLAGLVIVALAVGLGLEWSRRVSDWIQVYREDFTDGRLDGPWKTLILPGWQDGHAREPRGDDPALIHRVSGGRLLFGTANEFLGAVNLIYQGELSRDVRMSWRYTPLHGGNNLNSFVGDASRNRAYTFHLIGNDEGFRVSLSDHAGLGGLHNVAYATRSTPILVGRSYAFQLEQIGDRIRLLLDGDVLIDYRSPDVLLLSGRQQLGLEVAGNRVAIDNIEISQLPPPPLVSPLEVARHAESYGDTERALQSYRELAAVYPIAGLGGEARYGQLRCLLTLGRHEDMHRIGRQVLADLADHPRLPDALFEMARLSFAEGAVETGLDRLEAIGGMIDPEHYLWPSLGNLLDDTFFATYRLGEAMPVPREDLADHLELVRERYLARAQAIGIQPRGPLRRVLSRCISLLFAAHEQERILDDWQPTDRQLMQALLDLGREEEAIARWPDDRWLRRTYLRRIGDRETLIREFGDDTWMMRGIYLSQGRFDDLLTIFPDDRSIMAAKLYAAGDDDRILSEFPEQNRIVADVLIRRRDLDALLQRDFGGLRWPRFYALIRLGRFDEAQAVVQSPGEQQLLDFTRGARLIAEGDAAAGRRLCREAMAVYPDYRWDGSLLLWPLIHMDDGREAVVGQLERLLGDLLPGRDAKRIALLRYVSGAITEETMRQTVSSNDTLLPLALAMRLDLAGDTAAAREAYRSIDSDIEAVAQDFLVDWRLRRLDRP